MAMAAALAVVVRNSDKERALEEVLDIIEAAPLCHQPGSSRCSTQLSDQAQHDFDLKWPGQERLLGFLWAQALGRSRADMSEILRGAHVWLPAGDDVVSGQSAVNESMLHGLGTYLWLRSTEGSWKRISSHESTEDQYQLLAGRYLSCVLTGVIQQRTWLQYEGAPMRLKDISDLPGFIAHQMDFLVYKLMFRFNVGQRRYGPTVNIGPLGWSKFTDIEPLIVEQTSDVSAACPEVCGPEVLTVV